MFRRLAIVGILSFIFALAIVPVTIAQDNIQPVTVVTESGEAVQVLVLEDEGWTPERALLVVIPLASVITIVVITFIQNGTVRETVLALKESKESQDKIESAVMSAPPWIKDLLYGVGGVLRVNPHTKDAGELLQGVSDGEPNLVDAK